MTINCTTIDHRTSLPFPLHCGESLNQGLHREDVAKWFVATSSHGCLQLVDLLFSIWVGPFTSALCHCPDDWYCQRYGWSTSLVLEVWLHICPIWSAFRFFLKLLRSNPLKNIHSNIFKSDYLVTWSIYGLFCQILNSYHNSPFYLLSKYPSEPEIKLPKRN